jgi:hypothetical protein
MLQHNKLSLLDVLAVFVAPGIFIAIGHANHDGSSPGNGKQAGKGDKEGQTFPTHRENIFHKTHGGVATSCKWNGLDGIFNQIKFKYIQGPYQNFENMNEGDDDK